MRLEFTSAHSVEPSLGDHVFRVAIIGRILGIGFVGGIAAVCVAAAVGAVSAGMNGLQTAIAWWCAAWLGLFALLLANDVRKALRPEAWLVIVGASGVHVKWRSYQNVSPAEEGDVDVVVLPHRAIALARINDREWVTPGRRGAERSARHRFVELTLQDVDTTTLEEALRLERSGRTQTGSKRSAHWAHHPVTLEPGGILRIEWGARGKPEHLLDVLRERGVPIGDAAASRTELVRVGSDDDVREIARRGDVMTLIAVLRKTRGLDLTSAHTQARALVEAESAAPR
ncbi:MAG: hypothetical protein IPH13_02580 [Planctomycetes bacterium]|nr:hypothetical protein [Planctomycetota bacterium]MCC7170032.1 hypothetical protein [Planctomycetota bacterium]